MCNSSAVSSVSPIESSVAEVGSCVLPHKKIVPMSTILDASSPNQEPKSASKVVNFDAVHIREHARILGDSPSVSVGPPISLSWDAEASSSFPIDEYESVRSYTRRARHEFQVPAGLRVSRKIQTLSFGTLNDFLNLNNT